MYTIDASVFVSAVNPTEAASTISREFLAQVRRQRSPIFSPTLLIVEVAAAIARRFGDRDRAIALAQSIRDLPDQILVPLDDEIADRAAALAAQARLRGADAVYAAVAQQYGTMLVTLDRQQLDRLSPLVQTARPSDLLI